MEEIVYLNGNLIPSSMARLSPFDHGFLYGYGIFETMRSYKSSVFRLDRHLARLRRSAEILGIDSKLASFKLEKACYDVLRANNLSEARLRLTVSAGRGDITPNPDTCADITVFIAACKLVSLPSQIYERGFKAILSSCRRNSHSPLSRLKSICYLENVLARQEAKTCGADEAVLLNEEGLLTEGSTTNIFLINKGALVTPAVETGVLPGITREAVLELSQSLGIKAIETEVNLEELANAEEAFLTNSIIEVMPLTQFNDKPVGLGKAGTSTKQFMAAYTELTVKEKLT